MCLCDSGAPLTGLLEGSALAKGKLNPVGVTVAGGETAVLVWSGLGACFLCDLDSERKRKGEKEDRMALISKNPLANLKARQDWGWVVCSTAEG